jgi:spermidine synthase
MFTVSSWTDDPRWGPCLAAGILLGVPAFGLSGVLPALLRLSVGDMGHVGRHTGGMIAVSTIGSLLGTWGTAFFLLSWMGSARLIAVLGIIQVVLGLLWSWRTLAVRTQVRVKAAGHAALLATCVGLAWLGFHPRPPYEMKRPPVHQEDSPYQQIRVRDTDLHRFLVLDRTFHAVMWHAEPAELFLPYSQLMMAALAVPPSEPADALILGHGGGSLAKWVAKYWPALRVDAVEVDPSVVDAAQRFFGYEAPPTHHVVAKDARLFLRTTQQQYDVIWVDVFARHLVPFHLTTREFYEELSRHLKPDGIAAINLSSGGERADQARAAAIVATMRTVFPTFAAYGVKGPWATTNPEAQNYIFFAGPSAGRMTTPAFVQRVERWIAERRLPPEALTLLAGRREKAWPAGTVLTDDYAPFDLLIGRGDVDSAPPLAGGAP